MTSLNSIGGKNSFLKYYPYYLLAPLLWIFFLIFFGFFIHPLPFVDVIGFAFLDGLTSTQLSIKSDFYTTQFTYIVLHLFFRFLNIWGLTAIQSGTLIFFLQSVCFMTFISIFLKRQNLKLIEISFLLLFFTILSLGVAMLVWGGPLYFSFGVAFALLSYAIFVVEEQSKDILLIGLILSVASVMSHPFIYPILIILFLSSYFFLGNRQRFFILISIISITIISLSSAKDFSELYGLKNNLLDGIFNYNLSAHSILSRAWSIIIFQNRVIEGLLGDKSLTQLILSYMAGLIVVFGFFVSSITLLNYKFFLGRMAYEKSIVVALFLLFIYYLITPESPFGIHFWPQRLTIALLPLSFVLLVINFLRIYPKRENWHGLFSLFVVLMFIFFHLSWLSKISTNFISEAISLENEVIIKAGNNKYFKFIDFDNIKPFWLRSIPFTLFTSQRLREVGLIYVTEWHSNNQHNIRSAANICNYPIVEYSINRICDDVECSWNVIQAKTSR